MESALLKSKSYIKILTLKAHDIIILDIFRTSDNSTTACLGFLNHKTQFALISYFRFGSDFHIFVEVFLYPCKG